MNHAAVRAFGSILLDGLAHRAGRDELKLDARRLLYLTGNPTPNLSELNHAKQLIQGLQTYPPPGWVISPGDGRLLTIIAKRTTPEEAHRVRRGYGA